MSTNQTLPRITALGLRCSAGNPENNNGVAAETPLCGSHLCSCWKYQSAEVTREDVGFSQPFTYLRKVLYKIS